MSLFVLLHMAIYTCQAYLYIVHVREFEIRCLQCTSLRRTSVSFLLLSRDHPPLSSTLKSQSPQMPTATGRTMGLKHCNIIGNIRVPAERFTTLLCCAATYRSTCARSLARPYLTGGRIHVASTRAYLCHMLSTAYSHSLVLNIAKVDLFNILIRTL